MNLGNVKMQHNLILLIITLEVNSIPSVEEWRAVWIDEAIGPWADYLRDFVRTLPWAG